MEGESGGNGPTGGTITLPIVPPISPMLCRLEDRLPTTGGWVYEPKWDGFRGILLKDGAKVSLLSRNSKDLSRYFPSLIASADCLPDRCVLDGEIIAVEERRHSFELLQGVLSGDKALTAYATFDLLALEDRDLRSLAFSERRTMLESIQQESDLFHLTPQTEEAETAEQWVKSLTHLGFEGVVAKRSSLPYLSGERAMVKVKHWESADLVIGGYTGPKGDPRALLLGAFDEHGVLHHVGGTTVLNKQSRIALGRALRPLEGRPSFTGQQPGVGPWGNHRSGAMNWVSVEPTLVAEVSYNRLESGRIRHAARFIRWRTDKPPEECTIDSLPKLGPQVLRSEG